MGKMNFPVVWEAKLPETIQFKRHFEETGLSYVIKRNARAGGESAISALSDRDFFIRETLFPDEDSRREHSLVRVTMKDMLTAHIYPVEPPLPPPKIEDYVLEILGTLPDEDLVFVYEELTGSEAPKKSEDVLALLQNYAGNSLLLDALDALDARTAQNGQINGPISFEAAFGNQGSTEARAVARRAPFDQRSEYLKRVCDVRTSSQRCGRVVTAVRALSATEEARIEDRLGGFTTYGQPGDVELMDELFRLGSQFRASVSRGADTTDMGEMKIDESIIFQTITDKTIGSIRECRPLLDCIYGTRTESAAITAVGLQTTYLQDGSVFTLNAEQSRAVRLYADEDGPLAFCILSPPGSGKTTVAAAMAAEVGREARPSVRLRRGRYNETIRETYYGSVQLLLSVQNVAVDNMGSALKKMDFGGGQVYNMKSSKKLDFKDPAPYDFFDLMNDSDLRGWKTGETIRTTVVNDKAKSKQINRKETKEKKAQRVKEECITQHRREFEKRLCPKIILSTVEMVLQKMYTDSKLCSFLPYVKRVIIDEASLMTEAALYAIIRRFPQARIVLIGDEHQLPPFMYDPTILGQELAGRPALSVAMKTGRVPVVELNEIYRAPPSLAAPYNRLAYGGRLVSKKAEGERPLSQVGLVHDGLPQLLLIDVDGREERNEETMSLSNQKEIEALLRLLKKFSRDWAKDIMIICLYKDQKKKLEAQFEKEYASTGVQYKVLTVDSAQGKESPIVILLTTRTQRATDFFCSTERCNVAVSRQQKALVILGKAPLLLTNKPWSTVVNGDDFTHIRATDLN